MQATQPPCRGNHVPRARTAICPSRRPLACSYEAFAKHRRDSNPLLSKQPSARIPVRERPPTSSDLTSLTSLLGRPLLWCELTSAMRYKHDHDTGIDVLVGRLTDRHSECWGSLGVVDLARQASLRRDLRKQAIRLSRRIAYAFGHSPKTHPCPPVGR